VLRTRLLKRGGLATSTVSTGQQWDAPNAWAPLQWIAIEGLRHYREITLAETIAQQWMLKVITAYRATGKLMEKYNAEDASLVTGGGEYPTQDSFGWTNGALRKLLVLYPDAFSPRLAESWCVSSPTNDNVPAARGREREKSAPSPLSLSRVLLKARGAPEAGHQRYRTQPQAVRCSSQANGPFPSISDSVSPFGCRSSSIASTMSGARQVSGRSRQT
jgi:Trehalase